MATINDIAREAGVSHGTVSNVLNHRGVVSAEKIRLVMEAAEKLGYRVNAAAQNLRQGSSSSVMLLLPSLTYSWCAIFYEELKKELADSGFSLTVCSTGGIESEEKQMLVSALGRGPCAVIADSCLPDAAAFYAKEADGIPVFLLRQAASSLSGICAVGFHYDKMGTEIAAYLIRHRAKTVGLLIPEKWRYPAREFLSAFTRATSGMNITTHVVTSPGHQADLQAFSLFRPDLPYDYLVCSDMERLHAAKVAHSYVTRKPDPEYIAVAPLTALTDIRHPYYSLDYKMLAHRVGKELKHVVREEAPLPGQILAENSGFPKLPAIHRQKTELNMLTVTSPSADALSLLLPQLEESQGIRLNLSVMNLDEIYQMLNAPGDVPEFDLIRMDVAWLNELGEKVYLPLEETGHDWQALTALFMPEFTVGYTSVGSTLLSLPFDPSTQLLFYRKDLLEDPLYQRLFFEKTGKKLTVPQDFTAYNEVAEFFTQKFSQESPTPYGTTIAIGNNMVIASEYYVRLLALGADLLNEKGEIAVNSETGISALNNLTRAYQFTDGVQYPWWKDALKGFAEGSAAMTIVFMNHAADILNLQSSTIAGKVSYAPVPGGHPLSGGGVIGISRHSRKIKTACRFFDWLYSAPIAAAFTMLGGLSPCRSVYDNRDIYEKYPWLSTAKKSFPKAQHRRASALYSDFSQYELEKILSRELKSAVLGMASSEEALRRAQRICELTFHLKQN